MTQDALVLVGLILIAVLGLASWPNRVGAVVGVVALVFAVLDFAINGVKL